MIRYGAARARTLVSDRGTPPNALWTSPYPESPARGAEKTPDSTAMTVRPPTDRQTRISARHATIAPVASIASWATLIGPPGPEARRSQLLARFGGLASVTTLTLYVIWRVGFTMPQGGWNLFGASLLVTFEAVRSSASSSGW